MLAERLGKTVAEIGEMGSDEFTAWLAFDEYAEKVRKKKRKK